MVSISPIWEGARLDGFESNIVLSRFIGLGGIVRALLRYDGAEPALSTEAWVKLAVLTPLFVALYWVVLRWLWDKTNPINGEANWGHAICIPFVGLYYLYINREDLLAQPVEPLLAGRFGDKWRLYPALGMLVVGGLVWVVARTTSLDVEGMLSFCGMMLGIFGALVLFLDWGLGSLLFGLLFFAYGIYPGKNQFLQGCGMIVTLFGVVLTLTGWKIMKYAWFPIVYLICGIPWPGLVYSYIASPLQTFAARIAVKTLQFTGVTAYRTGTKINMGGIGDELRTLNVAEACGNAFADDVHHRGRRGGVSFSAAVVAEAGCFVLGHSNRHLL